MNQTPSSKILFYHIVFAKAGSRSPHNALDKQRLHSFAGQLTLIASQQEDGIMRWPRPFGQMGESLN